MKDALRGPYFRVYANIVNNPKVARLSDSCFRVWIELMAVAADHFGFSGEDCKITFTLEKLAWYMGRRDEATLEPVLDELQHAKLINRTQTGIEIHEWGFWQAPTTPKEKDFKTNTVRAIRRKATSNDSKVTPNGRQVTLIDSKVTPPDSSGLRVTPSDSYGRQSDSPEQSRAEQSSDSANQRVAPSAPPTGGLPVAPKPKGPDFKRTPEEQAEFERSIAEGIRDWKAKGFKLHADDQAILDRHFPEQAKAKYKRTPEQEKELKDFVASLSPEHRALLEAKEAAGK